MIFAFAVAVFVIVAFVFTRIRLERGRRAKPPLADNIARIRKARESGWSGVSEELDTLLYQQWRERMDARRDFWRRVAEAEARKG